MPADRGRWVHEMLEASKATADKLGASPGCVTPHAIVAQAALETGWGASAIGNNLFGIKAGAGWKGLRQLRRTREVIDGNTIYIDAWFRDYPTLSDGINDHFAVLAQAFPDTLTATNNSEYYRAFEHGRYGRYATDPNYVETLEGVEKLVRAIEGTEVHPPPPRLLFLGDKGQDVLALQKALNAQSDAMLDEDGVFGSTTMLAVRHFQEARGLQVDGVVGRQTRDALGMRS